MRAWACPHREISTHSAREDGDISFAVAPLSRMAFQPTPPARTETNWNARFVGKARISTHSAREDGDKMTVKGNQQ